MSDIAADGNEVVQPTPPPPQIDHLSFLPDELLDPIFKSAYSTRPPEFPLSKYLYPFFEQYLYRNVLLSSPRQVDLFLETITAHSERGKLVKSLKFNRKEARVVKSIDILESLLPHLPNLLHLEIKAESIEVGTRSKILLSSLPNIISVSTEPRDDEGHVKLDYFAFLASLPSLSDLTVNDWPSYPETTFEEEEACQLLHVKTLRIEGEGAEENSIKALVDLCPALLSVSLSATCSANPMSFGEALKVLPPTLHSLKLRSDYALIEPGDRLLLRFRQLHSLDLDEGCYSEMIHETLSQLSLLVEIRLGQGRISPHDFLPLVSGPTRLIHLQQIVLDFDAGVRGRMISQGSYAGEEELEGMNDWSLPKPPSPWDDQDDEEIEGRYDPEDFADLKELVFTAGVDGVEIKGQISKALANIQDYWIEASNRAVLSIFLFKENTDRLGQVRSDAAESGVSLPPLDVDSLELAHLELVKIDLPERDWFMYSLENGGGGVSD